MPHSLNARNYMGIMMLEIGRSFSSLRHLKKCATQLSFLRNYIYQTVQMCISVTNLGGNMARFTQFPPMITRSTIIYEIISPGAAGSSIYV